MPLTRRQFLQRIAQAGGYSATFATMQSLGLLAAPPETASVQDLPKDAFSLNLRCIRVTPAYFHREALGTRKRATQGAYAAQPDNVMALSARERRSKSVDMSRYNSSAIRSSSRGR